jgi:hypothetical protein
MQSQLFVILPLPLELPTLSMLKAVRDSRRFPGVQSTAFRLRRPQAEALQDIVQQGENMTAFENATKFFNACDGAEGWAGCKPYVADGATFTAQSEPLVEIHTVEAYCEWMAGFGNTTVPGATYDIHTSCFDEKTRTAVFFATYHARHTGAGGPVPPTNKETHSHYVYFLTMNEDNKVARMVKVWNATWAMKELGWV